MRTGETVVGALLMRVNPICVSKCDSASVACIEKCFRSAGWEPSDGLATGLPIWSALTLGGVLMLLSGLFSGLTLGLLSLDPVSLRILEKAGDPKERRYAKTIMPVRKNGNRLLCTLLLGNVVVNSALSILLSDLTSGLVGLIASTIVILVFGEILPQSICSRHGLMIGAYSIWLVRFFIILFLPITYPTSILLDCMLGQYVGTVYSKDELKKLIDIHVEDPEAQRECGLTEEDHKLLIGTLDLKAKKVKEVMTSLDQVYMLDRNTKLNFEKLSEIYKSGYSRIPVFTRSVQNIVGILFVKDLVLVNPDDEVELGTIMSLRGQIVGRVYEDVTLDKLLKMFMTSPSHLLIVHKRSPSMRGKGGGISGTTTADGSTAVIGLITLEDVIEEVLQDEIIDETDNAEMSALVSSNSLGEHGRQMTNPSELLQFFDHKLHGEKLSRQEVKAILSFLINNVEEFKAFASNENKLVALIRQSELVEVEEQMDSYMPPNSDSLESQLLTHKLEDSSNMVLYSPNRPTPVFTLVLQGKVLIRTGAEGFMLELGSWSTLGNKALAQGRYVPDFEARAVAPCRLLCIHKNHYKAALGSSRQGTLFGNSGGAGVAVANKRLRPKMPVDREISVCGGSRTGASAAEAYTHRDPPSIELTLPSPRSTDCAERGAGTELDARSAAERDALFGTMESSSKRTDASDTEPVLAGSTSWDGVTSASGLGVDCRRSGFNRREGCGYMRLPSYPGPERNKK